MAGAIPRTEWRRQGQGHPRQPSPKPSDKTSSTQPDPRRDDQGQPDASCCATCGPTSNTYLEGPVHRRFPRSKPASTPAPCATSGPSAYSATLLWLIFTVGGLMALAAPFTCENFKTRSDRRQETASTNTRRGGPAGLGSGSAEHSAVNEVFYPVILSSRHRFWRWPLPPPRPRLDQLLGADR